MNQSASTQPSTAERTSPLAGSTAVVTGAAGALGAEICRSLARDGANLVIHHLGEDEAAAELQAEVEALGVRAVPVSADVSDWDQVANALARAREALGPIDILVNNAGWMESRSILDSDLAAWRRTLSVDLDGVFIVTRQLLPELIERNGRIVNLSSQLAYKGARDFAAYCAAKAGVLGLTRALAREVGPGVRVNAIAPGPIDTPMVRPHATAEWVAERTRDSVVGRLGLPEESGPALAFLVGPGASLIHGQTLHLNGGGVLG